MLESQPFSSRALKQGTWVACLTRIVLTDHHATSDDWTEAVAARCGGVMVRFVQHLAAAANNEPAAALLLQAGARVDVHSTFMRRPVDEATQPRLRQLLEVSSAPSTTVQPTRRAAPAHSGAGYPLHAAAVGSGGRADVVELKRLLVEEGAPPNALNFQVRCVKSRACSQLCSQKSPLMGFRRIHRSGVHPSPFGGSRWHCFLRSMHHPLAHQARLSIRIRRINGRHNKCTGVASIVAMVPKPCPCHRL